jgi:hypothetical protein
MADPGFLGKMLNYDVRSQCSKESKLKPVNRYLRSIQGQGDELDRAGSAAKQLFGWGR